jgi:hypothetical protein
MYKWTILMFLLQPFITLFLNLYLVTCLCNTVVRWETVYQLIQESVEKIIRLEIRHRYIFLAQEAKAQTR